MTTRKPEPSKQAQAADPVAEKPAPEPSQADQAHIATAGYWREQQAAINRIAKLKALRLAQGSKTQPPKPKPSKPKPKKKVPNRLDRPKTSRSRRWRS
jgi:hypothetical protein